MGKIKVDDIRKAAIDQGWELISTEYKNLVPELQEYFTKLANGQYKMTEDAITFY